MSLIIELTVFIMIALMIRVIFSSAGFRKILKKIDKGSLQELESADRIANAKLEEIALDSSLVLKSDGALIGASLFLSLGLGLFIWAVSYITIFPVNLIILLLGGTYAIYIIWYNVLHIPLAVTVDQDKLKVKMLLPFFSFEVASENIQKITVSSFESNGWQSKKHDFLTIELNDTSTKLIAISVLPASSKEKIISYINQLKKNNAVVVEYVKSPWYRSLH